MSGNVMNNIKYKKSHLKKIDHIFKNDFISETRMRKTSQN